MPSMILGRRLRNVNRCACARSAARPTYTVTPGPGPGRPYKAALRPRPLPALGEGSGPCRAACCCRRWRAGGEHDNDHDHNTILVITRQQILGENGGRAERLVAADDGEHVEAGVVVRVLALAPAVTARGRLGLLPVPLPLPVFVVTSPLRSRRRGSVRQRGGASVRRRRARIRGHGQGAVRQWRCADRHGRHATCARGEGGGGGASDGPDGGLRVDRCYDARIWAVRDHGLRRMLESGLRTLSDCCLLEEYYW